MNAEIVARLVLFVGMAGSGALLIWLAGAAASGKLKRNQIAGIRTSKTLVSDEAWLAAHKRAKVPTLWAGVAALVGGVAAVVPISLPMLMVTILITTGFMLGLVIYGTVVGGRAADEVTKGG